MTAGIAPLKIEQGATFNKVILWQVCGGTPVDITGYTAYMEIEPSVGTPFILSTGNGLIVIDGPNGKLTLTILASDTALFTWTSGKYELNLTSPSTFVTRLLQGPVTVIPSII